ncbi:hypothetical protein FA13DRAFT_1260357 [Coprinellus micaceus]|uniref:Uncharacterized protein n=1 Tax=Coprinellus micaceus TaxID=71717 RepID=A0A4Y7ST60_COPMI|nr:hypothetical protein FA13DRAFT_1260357 [Coprinellus micaceus]
MSSGEEFRRIDRAPIMNTRVGGYGTECRLPEGGCWSGRESKVYPLSQQGRVPACGLGVCTTHGKPANWDSALGEGTFVRYSQINPAYPSVCISTGQGLRVVPGVSEFDVLALNSGRHDENGVRTGCLVRGGHTLTFCWMGCPDIGWDEVLSLWYCVNRGFKRTAALSSTPT